MPVHVGSLKLYKFWRDQAFSLLKSKYHLVLNTKSLKILLKTTLFKTILLILWASRQKKFMISGWNLLYPCSNLSHCIENLGYHLWIRPWCHTLRYHLRAKTKDTTDRWNLRVSRTGPGSTVTPLGPEFHFSGVLLKTVSDGIGTVSQQSKNWRTEYYSGRFNNKEVLLN